MNEGITALPPGGTTQKIQNPDKCKHERAEMRRKVNVLGVNMYKLQCQDCGAGVGEWVKKEKVPNFGAVWLWDEDLEAAGNNARGAEWEIRRAVMQAEADTANTEWWDKYCTYLDSPEWAQRRRACLQRDHNICTARLPGCDGVASQVHHLNYDHVFNEPLFDLASVCEKCHKKITEMDRARRT